MAESLIPTVAAIAAAICAYIDFRIVGFLGVVILGVLIAVRIELEKDAPISHQQSAHLVAHLAAAKDRM